MLYSIAFPPLICAKVMYIHKFLANVPSNYGSTLFWMYHFKIKLLASKLLSISFRLRKYLVYEKPLGRLTEAESVKGVLCKSFSAIIFMIRIVRDFMWFPSQLHHKMDSIIVLSFIRFHFKKFVKAVAPLFLISVPLIFQTQSNCF